MALIQVNYLSKSLFRTVTMNVILPVDKLSFDHSTYEPIKSFKTLYLLHGLLGNYTYWVTNTRIQMWAEEKNLAVVMPSGDNSFYVNSQLVNNDYGSFIGEELVEITRKMFPLSNKREDTFIGGLSMGGYGALRNGIKYADTFGYVIGLSSAIHLLEDNAPMVADEGLVFGDIKEARKTDVNPRVAVEKVLEKGIELPKFYMACGTKDNLLEYNRSFKDFLIEHGADVYYEEEEYAHEWPFWDRQIKKAIDWLPLDEEVKSMTSGSVTE